MKPAAIENWHRIVDTKDVALLDLLLAEDAVFLSPVVYTPQRGKAIVKAYLTAAMRVLNGDKFHYLGEWCGPNSAVLEFSTEVDGVEINGVDIIGWNAAGKIDHFKVMVRPLKAINHLHQLMAAQLAKPAAAPA
jgi:hypothetical protein